MNEPAVFVDAGDPTLPLSTRHSLEGAGGDHREAHNVYGLRAPRLWLCEKHGLSAGRGYFPALAG